MVVGSDGFLVGIDIRQCRGQISLTPGEGSRSGAVKAVMSNGHMLR